MMTEPTEITTLLWRFCTAESVILTFTASRTNGESPSSPLSLGMHLLTPVITTVLTPLSCLHSTSWVIMDSYQWVRLRSHGPSNTAHIQQFRLRLGPSMTSAGMSRQFYVRVGSFVFLFRAEFRSTFSINTKLHLYLLINLSILIFGLILLTERWR